MSFDINIGVWGWLVLLVGAVVLGVIIQLVGEAEVGFEWIITGIAALVGGLAASEFIDGWRGYEPLFDGLALIPALIGGLVVGIVVGVATRFITGGTYAGTTT